MKRYEYKVVFTLKPKQQHILEIMKMTFIFKAKMVSMGKCQKMTKFLKPCPCNIFGKAKADPNTKSQSCVHDFRPNPNLTITLKAKP